MDIFKQLDFESDIQVFKILIEEPYHIIKDLFLLLTLIDVDDWNAIEGGAPDINRRTAAAAKGSKLGNGNAIIRLSGEFVISICLVAPPPPRTVFYNTSYLYFLIFISHFL